MSNIYFSLTLTRGITFYSIDLSLKNKHIWQATHTFNFFTGQVQIWQNLTRPSLFPTLPKQPSNIQCKGYKRKQAIWMAHRVTNEEFETRMPKRKEDTTVEFILWRWIWGSLERRLILESKPQHFPLLIYTHIIYLNPSHSRHLLSCFFSFYFAA
jgi:hypothetical protein